MSTYKGSISLIKLSDGAPGTPGATLYTWIKYADDEKGTNLSDSAEGKAYIGIAYNKTTASESENYLDYQWSKIQGADGENAPEVIVQYSSDSADWHNTLQENDIYIRFSYDGGKTYSNSSKFVGTDGQDGEKGEDAVLYHLETNYEQVFKYIEDGEDYNSPTTKLSPSEITFNLKKQVGDSIEEIGDLKDYGFSIGFVVAEFEYGDIIKTVENYLGENNFFDKTNKKISFEKLFQFKPQEDQELDEDFENILMSFKESTGFFVVEVYRNDEILIQKPIKFEYGLDSNAASFSLYKTKIENVVGNTHVIIDSNGLTVQDGNFYITRNLDGSEERLLEYTYGETYEKTYDESPIAGKTYYTLTEEGYSKVSVESFSDGIEYYEKNLGKLKINGNSIFSGKLEAASGTFAGELTAASGVFTGTLKGVDGDFTGSITANTGVIGGFKITSNSIESTDGKIKLLNNIENRESSIEVDNIKLGVGAEIKDYIKLGDAYIYNPIENSNKFIEICDNNKNSIILINDNGTAKFGAIDIDGINSKIYGTNFSITPDKAIFSNVDVTGTIHTSVFETGKTQAVGGSMIFRPSSKIKEVQENDRTIILEDPTESFFDIGDYVIITYDDGTNENPNVIIEKGTETITLLREIALGKNPHSIIQLGNNGKEEKDTLVIGVNSGDNAEGILKSQGISFMDFVNSEYDKDTGEINFNTQTKLFLGNLNSLGKDGIYGYGLYGENVYLTGSLVTLVNGNSYAGVNTLNGVTATKFKGNSGVINDESPIVFWAGAQSLSTIADAKFQVTENGSIYASQGIFEGTIITKAEIQASALRASTIYGEGTNPSLTIYNTRKDAGGIVFKEESEIEGEKSEKSVLKIDTGGLYSYQNNVWQPFISIDDNGVVSFEGKIENFGDEIRVGNLYLRENTISNFSGETEESYVNKSNLQINSELLSFYLNSDISKPIFNFSSNKAQLNSRIVEVTNTFKIGDTEGTLSYKPPMDNERIIGYDLFIS